MYTSWAALSEVRILIPYYVSTTCDGALMKEVLPVRLGISVLSGK